MPDQHLKTSPARKLIELVYEHEGHGMGRSRERSEAAVRVAVRLAIEYGLQFDPDDFKKIATPQSSSYHDTSIYRAGETEYALACGSVRGRFNRSAVQAFETWRKRKPFLIRTPGQKTPQRIHVGLNFTWYGERVSCTSFAEDDTYLTAVTYKPGTHVEGGLQVGTMISVENWKQRRIERISDDGLTITLGAELLDYGDFESGRKIDRRFKITHAAIKDYHAALDLRLAIHAKLNSLPVTTHDALRRRYESKWHARAEASLKLPELRELDGWIAECETAKEPESVEV